MDLAGEICMTSPLVVGTGQIVNRASVESALIDQKTGLEH